MLRFENVATPATALTGFVPESTASGVPVPDVMLTVTAPANAVAVLPKASRAVTTTAGMIGEFIFVVDGCTVNANTAAAPGVTVTLAVCVIVVPFAVAVTVFAAATVELKVPVIWPLAFVVPTGCVSVLPVPDAAKVTVAPLTGLPNASFTVTVSVVALEPELAVIVPGAAATVDWLALAGPAVAVAVNVTGLPVRVPELAVRPFAPATVPRVQEVAVAIPLAFVDTGVVGFTVPPPDVTAKVTATPTTGLLN